MSPRLEELYGTFHNLVDEIANIACHLLPLDTWIRVKGKRIQEREKSMAEIDAAKNAAFSLPSWYLEETHQRLRIILRESFRPLSDYLEELRLRFGYVIYEIDRDAVIASINTETECSFEEGISKVEDFNQLVRMINKMVHITFINFTFINSILLG